MPPSEWRDVLSRSGAPNPLKSTQPRPQPVEMEQRTGLGGRNDALNYKLYTSSSARHPAKSTGPGSLRMERRTIPTGVGRET